MRPPLPLVLCLLMLGAAVARADPPEVEATPGRVVLGQDVTVEVRVRVPRGAGPVRAAASSGTWERTRVEGGAERVFHWTPPPVRYPLWAVLAFWVEDGRAPEVTTVRLPLLGRTTLDVSTAPGAEVVVVVGDARFGPVKADGRGQAQVPVEVPPDATQARVLATRGTLTTDRSAPLEVPAGRPLVAALTPDPLPVEGGGWLIIAGDEERIAPSELTVEAEGATVKPVEQDRARYAVQPRADATDVSVTVRWRDAPVEDAVKLQGAVKPAPARPAEVAIIDTDRPFPAHGVLVPAAAVRPSLFLLGGAAFASGANGGPLLGLGVSVPLPVPVPYWRVAAEAEVGLRHASLDGQQGGTEVHSRVWGIPLLLSARATLFQRGSFQLDGRAGGGVLALSHHLSTQGIGTGDVFPAAVEERRVRAMGFLAAQGAYRLGRWSLLTEVRAALAPVETPSLRAQLGGVSVSAGLRFVP
ncbi:MULTISPECIES: hypothetical protein [unclassified Corallococcus]|uniref:hypothetical protein n=1 Tax=unclassified Corallococcus TaxID=2685029 RepID=UPI001A8CBC1C|nr:MULTISPECIES: hypothetical protein [unclassified Corallococcus]MBN9685455.1 hypothetical protein [Corallococcus sp. NCSPR001]WAS83097.1 hypothetical protein O0N60_27695 [Corallococcus sp. NCRR]